MPGVHRALPDCGGTCLAGSLRFIGLSWEGSSSSRKRDLSLVACLADGAVVELRQISGQVSHQPCVLRMFMSFRLAGHILYLQIVILVWLSISGIHPEYLILGALRIMQKRQLHSVVHIV